jgi:hypothetical protein
MLSKEGIKLPGKSCVQVLKGQGPSPDLPPDNVVVFPDHTKAGRLLGRISSDYFPFL